MTWPQTRGTPISSLSSSHPFTLVTLVWSGRRVQRIPTLTEMTNIFEAVWNIFVFTCYPSLRKKYPVSNVRGVLHEGCESRCSATVSGSKRGDVEEKRPLPTLVGVLRTMVFMYHWSSLSPIIEFSCVDRRGSREGRTQFSLVFVGEVPLLGHWPSRWHESFLESATRVHWSLVNVTPISLYSVCYSPFTCDLKLMIRVFFTFYRVTKNIMKKV